MAGRLPRAATLVVLILGLGFESSRAQLPHLMPPGSPWLDVNYPKLFWTPREGLTGGLYLAIIRQLPFDDADLPPPYAASIALDGQASTSGSRQISLEGRFPRLAKGWRVVGSLEAARRARDNYLGIGDTTTYDASRVTDGAPHYYQALTTRWFARGEVQRVIAGPLRALAGFHAERWRLEPLPGASLLAADAAALTNPSIGTNTTDVSVRAGLVLDTRDDEAAANRGVLVEAIHTVADAGIAGDLTYTRTTASVAGYVPVGDQLVLSARAVAQGMGGTPRLGSYYLIEASDRPYEGLGGSMSHRALADNRLLGRHKALLNLDARYHVVNLPRTARVTILGFFDAGRVFEGESLRLTTDGLKIGGGFGLFVQVARAGIVGTTAGWGPDGPVINFATKWVY